MHVYQVLGQLGSGTAGDSVSGIRKGEVGVEACSRPDLELCKAVTAEDVCDAWLSVRCCAACHRSKALRSRGTHFRHEVPVVVDAGPGDVMIAPAGHSAASSFPDRLLRHVDELRAASQSGWAVSQYPDACPRLDELDDAGTSYYQMIAEQLRSVEARNLENKRNANSTPAAESSFHELDAWLARCIYPWEMEDKTRWPSTRSAYLGSFKPGQLMLFTSKPVELVGSMQTANMSISGERTTLELTTFQAPRLLVDGEVVSVGNTVFSAFPPLHAGRPALPRPEGPRQSLRSGSRSDSFRGSGQGGCTEMHYSPRIWQRRGPELPLLFPCLSSPPLLLPFLPFSARGPGSQLEGGRRFVTMAHNRLLLYLSSNSAAILHSLPFIKPGRCSPFSTAAQSGTSHISQP